MEGTGRGGGLGRINPLPCLFYNEDIHLALLGREGDSFINCVSVQHFIKERRRGKMSELESEKGEGRYVVNIPEMRGPAELAREEGVICQEAGDSEAARSGRLGPRQQVAERPPGTTSSRAAHKSFGMLMAL